MGGLIAATVAAVFNAPRLLLLTPAFKIAKAGGVALAPFIAPFLPVIRRNKPLLDSETDPVRRQLFPEYWSDDLVAGAAQFKKVLKAGRRDIQRVHSKVLVIVGGADTVVPASVAAYLQEAARGAASFESVEIPEGTHHLPFDASAEKTAKLVLEWLSR